jgi:hypothetical protein
MKMTMRLATVAWRDEDGEYVTTVSWDDEFKAWRSMPGLNQYARVPLLDAVECGDRTKAMHVGQMVGEVITGVLHEDKLTVDAWGAM